MACHEGFTFVYLANGIELTGCYHFNILNPELGERVQDSYTIAVFVDFRYPKVVPTVRELAGRIDKGFHMNGDILCLGVPEEMKIFIKNRTLSEFLDKYLNSYLYAHSFQEKYGVMPYADRSHGYQGIVEFYREYLDINDNTVLYILLSEAVETKSRNRNRPCHCGSGKKYEHCHKSKVDELVELAGANLFSTFVNLMGECNVSI